ncbi:MAG TPA: hypothetical protein VM935_10315 [Chitinophagaceae bacterium]|nr:hypothetical protein [Chitinophagaceae bacterium]
MYWSGKSLTCIILVIGISSCKKEPAKPAPANESKCVIKGETTGLTGNERSMQYSFDDKGRLSTVKVYNAVGNLESTSTISDLAVTHTFPGGGSTTYLYDANIFDGMPTKANVSLTSSNGVEQRNYYTYFFFYDARKRLIKVGQQTDHVAGDYEYDVNITYNDKDNVTALQYEFTTGPRAPSPPTTVAAYDDKPTPYAAIKNWKFLSINFAWTNYDPEPILTALSKNNPLDYTLTSGTTVWKREMVYTYNADGFPTERKNTNRVGGGASTFLQSFDYNCK